MHKVSTANAVKAPSGVGRWGVARAAARSPAHCRPRTAAFVAEALASNPKLSTA